MVLAGIPFGTVFFFPPSSRPAWVYIGAFKQRGPDPQTSETARVTKDRTECYFLRDFYFYFFRPFFTSD